MYQLLQGMTINAVPTSVMPQGVEHRVTRPKIMIAAYGGADLCDAARR